MLDVVQRGGARFAGDPRFELRFAEEGLRPRSFGYGDDAPLLHRICDAYCAALSSETDPYLPNLWWQSIRKEALGPVRRALASHDIDSLRRMYRNFFRDPCGTGVATLPGVVTRGFGQDSQNLRRILLIDTLHRLDLTGPSNLKTPDIGNPFGIMVDGNFIRIGAPDQLFYAHRLIDQIATKKKPVVAEIGGGYGGLAYFLLRDLPRTTYIDFDVPETIALASYYLLNAFPDKTARLYGETGGEDAEIVLMPASELPKQADRSVDALFGAHVLADLAAPSMEEYLRQMTRITRSYIFTVDRLAIEPGGEFIPVSQRPVDWNSLRGLAQPEIESLCVRSLSTQPAA